MATYALIPGGGGDPWEWHRLVRELASRGHAAVAVRLPAEDDTAGWSEYADTVVDAIGDRAGVILVAASMGGFTAPIVCTRRRVDLLVLVNAMIPMPGETFNTWGSNTGSGSARREYHASLGLSTVEAGDDAVIYYHDLPSELRAEAQARRWQDQSMTPLDEPWPLSSWPDVPTRVLSARHDRMFPLNFQRRVARERLAIEVDEIDGGHMVAMSNPAELTNRLEAYASQFTVRGPWRDGDARGRQRERPGRRLGEGPSCGRRNGAKSVNTVALIATCRTDSAREIPDRTKLFPIEFLGPQYRVAGQPPEALGQL